MLITFEKDYANHILKVGIPKTEFFKMGELQYSQN